MKLYLCTLRRKMPLFGLRPKPDRRSASCRRELKYEWIIRSIFLRHDAVSDECRVKLHPARRCRPLKQQAKPPTHYYKPYSYRDPSFAKKSQTKRIYTENRLIIINRIHTENISSLFYQFHTMHRSWWQHQVAPPCNQSGVLNIAARSMYDIALVRATADRQTLPTPRQEVVRR